MPTEISGSTGVNKIQDDTVVAADIASSVPLGKVLQVVEGGINNVSTHAAGSSTYDQVYTVTLNNVQSNSTIVGFISWQGYRASSNNHDFSFGVFRGSTSVGGGDAGGGSDSLLIQNARGPDYSMSFNLSGQFADTGHGGGTVTYGAKIINEGTVTLGRPSQTGDARHGRTRNNLILFEIGA